MAEEKYNSKNDSLTRWTAIKTRDASANGAFYYGAKSTLIFCRPSCPARLVRRSNVVYFDGVPDALKAGYRACKRCEPCNPLWHRNVRCDSDFEKAKNAITNAVVNCEPWTTASVAEKIGISSGHLHRLFKKYASETPREFAKRVCGEQGRKPGRVETISDSSRAHTEISLDQTDGMISLFENDLNSYEWAANFEMPNEHLLFDLCAPEPQSICQPDDMQLWSGEITPFEFAEDPALPSCIQDFDSVLESWPDADALGDNTIAAIATSDLG